MFLRRTLSVSLALGLFVTRIIVRQLGGEPAYAAEVVSRVAAGDLTVNVQLRDGGQLVWHAPEGSGLPDATTEPDASAPLRLMLQLLGPLAPDHLL